MKGILRNKMKCRWRTALAPLVTARDRFMFSDLPCGWRRKWPVRGSAALTRQNPFFIVGFPRSGTTLLRAILALHVDIFIPPENGALGEMIRTFGAHRRSSWQEVVSAVLDKFQTGYEFSHWDIDLEQVTRDAHNLPAEERTLTVLIGLLYQHYGDLHAPGRTRWGDKTVPGDCAYLPKIGMVFPRAHYIHVVRDGRACVASAMKQGMFGGDLVDAAFFWKETARQCRRFEKSFDSPFHSLRYEDLVTEPVLEIKRLCHFLGIKPTDAMLAYTGAEGIQDVETITHHENVRNPISRESLVKWKKQLSKDEQEAVMKIIGDEMRRYTYE